MISKHYCDCFAAGEYSLSFYNDSYRLTGLSLTTALIGQYPLEWSTIAEVPFIPIRSNDEAEKVFQTLMAYA